MVISRAAATPFLASASQPPLTLVAAVVMVEVEQGGMPQTLSTHAFHGVRREPWAPRMLTRPMRLLQDENSLVIRPPAAAWHWGDRLPISAFMSIWAEAAATQASRMN